MTRSTLRRALALLPLGAAFTLLPLLPGCGSPNQANVALRRERDQHLAEIESLKQQLAADRQRLQSLESQVGTLPTLPQARLDHLFTAHDIRIGRQTGGYDADPSKPGDEAIKVYLSVLDDAGDVTKATGHVTAELFNLDRPNDARLAAWEFTPEQLKQNWRSFGPLAAFVLVCPLESPVQKPDLLLRLTFRDELTGRTFTKVQQIRLNPPPVTTQPVARP